MKPNSARTKASMLSRLERAGFSLECISQDDYPEVNAELGWAESTFKTALKYLGKPHQNLDEGFRDYIPTLEERRTIEEELGDFGVLVCYLGVRYSQLWNMRISPDERYLRIPGNKGSKQVTLNLLEAPERVRQSILNWVTKEASQQSPHHIRRKWATLKDTGRISRTCNPHSMRHRLITELLGFNTPLPDISNTVGHRDTRTTERYIHTNPMVNTQLRNRAYEVSALSLSHNTTSH